MMMYTKLGIAVVVVMMLQVGCGSDTKKDATKSTDNGTAQAESRNEPTPPQRTEQDAQDELATVDKPYRVELVLTPAFAKQCAELLGAPRRAILDTVLPNGTCLGMMGNAPELYEGEYPFTSPLKYAPIDRPMRVLLSARRSPYPLQLIAWRADPDGTCRMLGLHDEEHVNDQGQRVSQLLLVSDTGRAAGIAFRYPEVNDQRTEPNGQSVWIDDGTASHQAGLFGPEFNVNHAFPVPVYRSTPVAMNNRGDLIGNSEMGGGRSAAWIYQNGETTRIGLMGEEYDESNRDSFTKATAINNLGHAIGISRYFRPRSSASYDSHHVWYYDGTETRHVPIPIEVGMSNMPVPFYLSDAGEIFVWAKGNIYKIHGEDAVLLGESRLPPQTAMYREQAYHPSHGLPRQEFLIHPDGTFAFSGFQGPAMLYHAGEMHTIHAEVPRDQIPLSLSFLESPQVMVGIRGADRPGQYDERGNDKLAVAWIYDGESTHTLELAQDQLSWADAIISYPVRANRNGAVVGVTRNESAAGSAVWYFDGIDTRRLGLLGEDYSWRHPYGDPEGQGEQRPLIQESKALAMNAAGQVLGLSVREPTVQAFHDGRSPQTFWLYSPETQRHDEIITQAEQGGGGADSLVYHLDDDGRVLGTFDRSSHDPGRGMIWSVEFGIVPLDRTTVAGMVEGEWRNLARPVYATDDGTVIGFGELTSRYAERLGVGRAAIFRIIATGVPPTESGDTEAQEESPAPAGSDAAPVSFGKVEDLARYVYECVANNDFEAFKHACITEADIVALLPSAESDRERDYYNRRIQQFQNGSADPMLLHDFQRTMGEVYWDELEIEFISGEPSPNQEHTSYISVLVHASNGRYIRLDSPAKINGRWVIGDDGPLGSGNTRPHHREEMIGSESTSALPHHPR